MLLGDAFVAPPLPSVDETVAIFAKEWLRDPKSEALKSGYQDAPWDDPKIISYYLAKYPRARQSELAKDGQARLFLFGSRGPARSGSD
ncbi:MAG: hypothetical protein NVS3B5_19980 [Sphingomicrobium sp.]